MSSKDRPQLYQPDHHLLSHETPKQHCHGTEPRSTSLTTPAIRFASGVRDGKSFASGKLFGIDACISPLADLLLARLYPVNRLLNTSRELNTTKSYRTMEISNGFPAAGLHEQKAISLFVKELLAQTKEQAVQEARGTCQTQLQTAVN